MCFEKMWRLSNMVFTRLSPTLCGIFPFSMYHSGPDDIPYPKPKELPDPNEKGWKRLKRVFQVDENGVLSDEVVISMQASYMGAFIGVCYGGTISGVDAYYNFIRNNEETIFQNHFEGKKLLQDRVTIAFGRGGVKWGWRIALLTGSAFLTANCVNVFLGRSTVFEYSIAGLVAGALYKIGDGLSGFIVGGGLGLVLGTIAGILACSIFWISGVNMTDIKHVFIKFVKSRDEIREQWHEDGSIEKEKFLTKYHDEMVGTNKDLSKLNEPLPLSAEKEIHAKEHK